MRRTGLQQTKCEGRRAACQRQKPRLKSDRPGRRVCSTPPAVAVVEAGRATSPAPAQRLRHPEKRRHAGRGRPGKARPVPARYIPAPLRFSASRTGSIRGSDQIGCLHTSRSMQVEDKRNGKSSLAEVQPAGLTYRGSGGHGGGKLQAIPCDLDPSPLSPVKATGGYEVH